MRATEALGACLLLVAATASMARAASAIPDSARQDSVRMVTPRGVLWRSALVPGWGQYCNGRYVKAAGFAAAAGGFTAAAVAAARAVDRAGTPEGRQDRAGQRNTRFLFLFATATLAAMDAYVDAQLADVQAAVWTGASGELLGLRLMRPLGSAAPARRCTHQELALGGNTR